MATPDDALKDLLTKEGLGDADITHLSSTHKINTIKQLANAADSRTSFQANFGTIQGFSTGKRAMLKPAWLHAWEPTESRPQGERGRQRRFGPGSSGHGPDPRRAAGRALSRRAARHVEAHRRPVGPYVSSTTGPSNGGRRAVSSSTRVRPSLPIRLRRRLRG